VATLLGVTLALVCAACRTAGYDLDVLEALHDEAYNLKYEIDVPTPFQQIRLDALSLVSRGSAATVSRRIDEPGTLCHDKILALGSRQPRDLGEYARAIAVLAPLSVLDENALSRSYALEMMVFLHRKFSGAPPSADGEPLPREAADEAISRLVEHLTRSGGDPQDPQVIEACRADFSRIARASYSAIGDAAAALRLFSRYWSPPGRGPFGDVTTSGIHRVSTAIVRLALLSALRDGADFVRADALQGLADFGDVSSAPRIAGTLRTDPSPDVRREAAQALARLADLDTVPDLLSALEEEVDSSVRWSAYAALVRIAGEDLGLEPEPWEDWWERKRMEAEEGGDARS